jgi:hypothetical protein
LQVGTHQQWVAQADDLVPAAPPEGTADDWLATEHGVFFSHAGEQKYGVVSVICREFAKEHPGVKVFLDEANVVPGAWSLPAIGQACRTAAVGACRWECYVNVRYVHRSTWLLVQCTH